ncbi:MAG: hypothetical protein ACD_29C00471G0004 [uncultured bacterium]|nr:MAG: hypothetical protein ACD_29C00471G0004 [uncultured bacterium]OGT33550.1 MAG: 6-phosphogluconate dehydrogenase (decarboxylating) [Gammaproteobacteria bacterium RIFCSPHIGHO2_02_FULL_39_13]OGT49565.1 MAG: 6-phosphogluconate dehydrogenase (decarboxylating) [Gammaproteobacteria bacterium RIFCSPHIGHO2_12_FULL_39_24]
MSQLEFGVIGLGRMGGGLALQAMKKGMKVAGYDRNPPNDALIKAGLIPAKNYQDFIQHLQSPRIIFIYIPSGPAIDNLMEELVGVLKAGDIVVDGGNSYWGDSIRRHKKYEAKGIHFLDLGTSGGLLGAETGACFMLGGTANEVSHVEPILKQLCVKDGYVHAGPPGSGHFVKLVHNGIEYGMLEAIGEGLSLLEACPLKINLQKTLDVYTHGSVIRSWLMELLRDGYRENQGVAKLNEYVDDTGEVNWLVDDAMHMEVSTPVIAQAVMNLIASRDGAHTSAKGIAMIRHGFGGHAYGHSQVSQDERYRGRVGGYYYNLQDPAKLIHSKED